MAEQSLIRNIIKKGVIGVILGIVLVAVARATHFPLVFQIMFFIYAMLGAGRVYPARCPLPESSRGDQGDHRPGVVFTWCCRACISAERPACLSTTRKSKKEKSKRS